MVKFTIQEYYILANLFKYNFQLREEETDYIIKGVNDKKVHQYHDKIFKKLLDDKKEFVYFMKKFFGYEIKEQDIEKYNRKFITNLGFKVRESDIIYKIKNSETFILLEHQSSIDYNMPIRMTEYCIRIIESRIFSKLIPTMPIIFPIVLSTAKKPWRVPNKIVQGIDKYYGFPKLQYPEYNLVDVNKYKNQELLQDKKGITLAMLLEKQKKKEELENVLKNVFKKGISEQERKCLYMILEYSEGIKKLLGTNLEYYKKELRKEEGGDMENFEKLYLELLEDKFRKGVSQGINQIVMLMLKNKIKDEDIIKNTNVSKKELRKEEGGDMENFEKLYLELLEDKFRKGVSQGISQIVMLMLKNKMKDEDIIKNTNISKKELEKLKLQIQ